MKYFKDRDGNRVLQATPEETHALRPSIAAYLRRHLIPEQDVDDYCQEVEIVTFQAIRDQRLVVSRFTRPVDALLRFTLATAWNVTRNHTRKLSTRREVLSGELPDIVGPNPEGRLDARETLLRLTSYPRIARILFDAVFIASTVKYVNVPKSTYENRVVKARAKARDIESGRCREPVQPAPPSPRHRKGKR